MDMTERRNGRGRRVDPERARIIALGTRDRRNPRQPSRRTVVVHTITGSDVREASLRLLNFTRDALPPGEKESPFNQIMREDLEDGP